MMWKIRHLSLFVIVFGNDHQFQKGWELLKSPQKEANV